MPCYALYGQIEPMWALGQARLTDTFQQIEHVVPCVYRHLGLTAVKLIHAPRYATFNFTYSRWCDIAVQHIIVINNTRTSNFSFYFIITKIMRHEFVLCKDNNKLSKLVEFLCIKYIKCILCLHLHSILFFWMNPKLR